jgi:hypothetical protein
MPERERKTFKFIYWNHHDADKKGRTRAEVHFLSKNWKDHTVTGVNKLVAKMKKSFPQINERDVTVSVIPRFFETTPNVGGAIILEWTGFLPEGQYPGWKKIDIPSNSAARYIPA